MSKQVKITEHQKEIIIKMLNGYIIISGGYRRYYLCKSNNKENTQSITYNTVQSLARKRLIQKIITQSNLEYHLSPEPT